jgi:DNA-binding NtrC family response regulator
MARVLLAWLGLTDLKAARGEASAGAGPIAQALDAREFDQVVLLNNLPAAEAEILGGWLKKRTKVEVVLHQHTLAYPTHYGDIYRAVIDTVAWVLEEYGKKTKLAFHLSPGTPAMTAIWIIVAKTRFDAELIESSKEKGVATVDVPFELAAEFIPGAVQRANADLARIGDGLRPEEPRFGDIHHRSDAMKRLVDRARQAAVYTAAVLIEGESGTGKELLARAIHDESPRGGKLVMVNCGAVPHELVESQFFGHMRGTFTGAVAEHAGYFEQAHGGTLFLDEVGELPRDTQVKLLRALQEKKVRRLGGKEDLSVDVRIIAATNRNLLEEVRAGRFREDLYYRLAVLPLRVPPLREREGDTGLLLDRFLSRLNAEHCARPGAVQKKLSVSARKLLLGHRWPGNVRELESTLQRAFVWSKGSVIDEGEARDALLGGPGSADENVLGRPLGDGFKLQDLLAEVARHYLERAMIEAAGKKTKAAGLVGFTNYQTLKNWLEKYGVRA